MFKKTIILLSIVAFVSCNKTQQNLPETKEELTEVKKAELKYNAKDFASKIEDSNAIVVDVRTPEEYKNGHLENALNIDWKGSEFDQQIKALDKKAPVYVYCLSGGRSNEAANELKKQGFENVYELEGGILAWRSENLPEADKITSQKGMTSNEYNQLLESDKLVLVDFYADWCAPCKKMKPYILNIEKQYTEKIKVLRINVDQNAELCKELKITGLPVLKLYSNKKEIWQNIGYIDEAGILAQLK